MTRISDEFRLVIKELASQTKMKGNHLFAKWKSPLNIEMHIHEIDRAIIIDLMELMIELNENSLRMKLYCITSYCVL